MSVAPLGKVAVLPVVLAVVFAAMLVLLPRTKSAH